MKCPHCHENFFEAWSETFVGEDPDGEFFYAYTSCAACRRYIFRLRQGGDTPREWLAHPRTVVRTPLPTEVPREFVEDYKEACAVLSDSPKASAALSRRCLQNIIREHAGIKPSNLSDEIDQVLASKTLPSHLAEALDAVRETGNFAAHPTKSQHTGEVVDVEPGEAEWRLDTLEGLFDFYFVQPAVMAKKKEVLNQKLADAGRDQLP